METPASTPRQKPGRFRWLLLAAPCIALLFPQVYARNTPVLFGFPFFYWYQFAWVLITALLLGIYYHLTKSPSQAS